MDKYIHNNSGSAKYYLGTEIIDDAFYLIPRQEEHKYAISDTLIADLTSGDAAMSRDGINDLGAADSLIFLDYYAEAFDQRFRNNSERGNLFVSVNVQEAIEELRDSFVGKGFQTTFVGNGTVINEWMKSEDANILSSQAPDVFKFNAKCVGIDWTNRNQNADPIIIICISNAGNGRNMDRFYKWELTNVRVAMKTGSNGFTVNAGDKMGIYVRDGGGNSSDAILTMDFLVQDGTTQEIIENYNNDFQSNSIPSTGSITEIFP